MERIVVAAHKGGAGKTTVAINLAGAFAAAGQYVLVVDVDPQGAASAGLGLIPVRPTVYDVLSGNASATEAIRPSGIDYLDILPADLDLAGAEVELPRRTGWQAILRNHLVAVDGYAVMIIDTPPGLGVLPYLALVAAQRALVVCPPDFLGLRALPSVLEAAKRAGVALIGIVPNGVERRTRHEADALDILREQQAGQMLPAIPRRVVVRDAAAAGRPVSQYAPGSEAAAAFERLAVEVTSARTT